jgi:hypothetical protein
LMVLALVPPSILTVLFLNKVIVRITLPVMHRAVVRLKTGLVYKRDKCTTSKNE